LFEYNVVTVIAFVLILSAGVIISSHTTRLMTMLGLGSFPAADVTAFQMYQDQSVEGRGGHCQRSVSPWTQQPVQCRQNYQLPADISSRHPSDQYTPQEYLPVTKLPPRQLQWVTSHTHGYDTPAAALSYDAETVHSTGHHLSQLHQVAVTTSNTSWSPQFNEALTQNQSATATDSSRSNHLLQSFQDPTKNYFVDCPEQVEDVAMQLVCGRGEFSDDLLAGTAYTAGQPFVSDCTSYCTTPANLYSGSDVKSDPDGQSDWQRTLPVVWYQQDVRSKSSPGQQAACAATSSSVPYPSTAPYTPVPADISPWSTTGEQKPMKVPPSMSIGEPTNSKLILSIT